jgi:serine protease Do
MKSLDAETAKQLGLKEGTSGVVVVAVKPGSPAAEKGLKSGDVLTQAGGKAVSSPADLNAQFAAAKRAGKTSVLALIKRSGGQRFIALPVGAA